jgi:hypothetical protein
MIICCAHVAQIVQVRGASEKACRLEDVDPSGLEFNFELQL